MCLAEVLLPAPGPGNFGGTQHLFHVTSIPRMGRAWTHAYFNKSAITTCIEEKKVKIQNITLPSAITCNGNTQESSSREMQTCSCQLWRWQLSQFRRLRNSRWKLKRRPHIYVEIVRDERVIKRSTLWRKKIYM